jgi:type I restriction enzyme S subunit
MEKRRGDQMVASLQRKAVIPPAPMGDAPIWRGIRLSNVVDSGGRLQASFYGMLGSPAGNAIADCKWKSLPLTGEAGLATAYTLPRFKRIWLDDSPYPIYQPSSIVDVKPAADGFLSEETAVDFDSLRVSEGQILLTCSGTIGDVTLVSATLDRKIFSHDLLRLNVADPMFAGLVYTYLKSGIGKAILQTNNYGAVIQHIEPEHLANIPVPVPPEEVRRELNGMVWDSFRLRDESNKSLDDAAKLLAEELALLPMARLEPDLYDNNVGFGNFKMRLSNLEERLDASYHSPLPTAIVKHMLKNAAEVTTVGDSRISAEILLPGRFKRVYVEAEHGVAFIGGKQIGELDPSNKKYLSLVHHGDRIKKQLELRENMTLITCSGTIGKVALVPLHWKGWAASQHVIRVVPACDEIAGYISVFLATDWGRKLIARFKYGSVVDEIDQRHVARIPLPLLKSRVKQAEINRLALYANEQRYQAYLMERKAMDFFERKVIRAE